MSRINCSRFYPKKFVSFCLVTFIFPFLLTGCPEIFTNRTPGFNTQTANNFFCDLKGFGTFSDLSTEDLISHATTEKSFIYYSGVTQSIFQRCREINHSSVESCLNSEAFELTLEEEVDLFPDFLSSQNGITEVLGPISRMGIVSEKNENTSPTSFQSSLSSIDFFNSQLECMIQDLPSKLRAIKTPGKSQSKNIDPQFYLNKAQKTASIKNEKVDLFSIFIFVSSFNAIFGDSMNSPGRLLEEDSFHQKFSYDFGNSPWNETRTKKFTFIVDGSQTITSLDVIKPLNSSGFKMTRDTCSGGLPLSPGEICEIEVNFGPIHYANTFKGQVDIIHPYLESQAYTSSIELHAQSSQPVAIDDNSCSSGYDCNINEVCSFGTCQYSSTHSCFMDLDCGLADCIDGHCQ